MSCGLKMKFMKLGIQPDTFYTEEATRAVISDVPSDLTIRVNRVTYLLHKYSLLPKCGLLQRLVSEKGDSSNVVIDMDDIPGGEEAFELCAKFCYGIAVDLSAHNFASAFCAANFLRMNENGNLAMKLEAFFSSCILEGWKDSILTLQNTEKVYEWSESLGIVRRCIESIVDKILIPPSKVTWSYTYTRPGYDKKSVPKDWWTEDISCLGIDMFRFIVTAVKSTNTLKPQLIGEALHVYASRWLLDESSTSQVVEENPLHRKQRILDTIVTLIPADKRSVSIQFVLRLLRVADSLGSSPLTKTELFRLSGSKLEEATLDDLLLLQTRSSDDVDLVKTILECFLRQWRRETTSADESQSMRSIYKVGKLVDLYVQVVASDANLPVQRVISLLESLPGISRPQHNDLYKAINIYLKEHPDVSKAEKKQLCSFLDCRKLSPEVRAHAVKNERLPLRTVVQLLFFEQEEKTENYTSSQKLKDLMIGHNYSKLSSERKSIKAKGNKLSAPGTSGVHQKQPTFETREVSRPETTTEREIIEEGVHGIQLNPQKKYQVRRVSERKYSKGRER